MLDEGQRAVLIRMGGDCTLLEWEELLGADYMTVFDYFVETGLEPKGGISGELRASRRRVLGEVERLRRHAEAQAGRERAAG